MNQKRWGKKSVYITNILLMKNITIVCNMSEKKRMIYRYFCEIHQQEKKNIDKY